MGDTNAAWDEWGKRDPYFGVFSDDRFRKESIGEMRNEFFSSGREFVTQRLNAAEKHFGTTHFRRALDFGCGVGRLAIPLAQRFDEVVGIDISDAMLIEARNNAERMGTTNVRFEKSDDSLTQATGLFDFVNSYIVLQHIPVVRGLGIIRALLDRVAPGGVAALHFSVDRGESAVRRAVYYARRNVYGVHGVINLLVRKNFGEPFMEMNEYPLAQILELAEGKGFRPAILETERHGRILTVTMLCQRSDNSP